MKKKRNPQDATLRNIRALKKRVRRLEEDSSGFYCAFMDLIAVLKLTGQQEGFVLDSLNRDAIRKAIQPKRGRGRK